MFSCVVAVEYLRTVTVLILMQLRSKAAEEMAQMAAILKQMQVLQTEVELLRARNSSYETTRSNVKCQYAETAGMKPSQGLAGRWSRYR